MYHASTTAEGPVRRHRQELEEDPKVTLWGAFHTLFQALFICVSYPAVARAMPFQAEAFDGSQGQAEATSAGGSVLHTLASYPCFIPCFLDLSQLRTPASREPVLSGTVRAAQKIPCVSHPRITSTPL